MNVRVVTWSWLSPLEAIVCLLACAAAGAALGQTTASSPSAPRTVVILGDSLAAGYGVDSSEAFPALLQQKVTAAGLPFKIVSAGVSGDTTAGGLRRLDWVLNRPVDVLLIELGGNDGLRGLAPEATRTNLQQIIDKTRAQRPDARFIIAGMQLPPNLGEEYIRQFERIFPEVAKANGAALIPQLLAGVGGDPKLNLPDRIHPTPAGHKLVAETVWKVLRPVLEETAKR
ncbi:hypothetical protein LBMAG56_11010 [Verrucomicrobiota bacterium]|nr:hypothetical protein LBMAG56_11010 [Verrucomicrobiota bacterium]